MALKLLNPGLRPLGQFDLDDDAAALDGGEYVELQRDNVVAVEGYAADVGAMAVAGGAARGAGIVNFTPGQRTAGNLGGLADEGRSEYGTLFGSQIGGNTGRQTQFANGAAVVVGPSTDAASGKVTVWHQPGLYGVTGGQLQAEHANAAIAVNDGLQAVAAGQQNGTDGDLTIAGAGQTVALYVAATTDTSLVSTTARAVGDAAIVEYHAVYLLGNARA
tara:strand:+ start:2127 stop:2783 length:657 start_codon:yes stop_codon:yes gene_type:complete